MEQSPIPNSDGKTLEDKIWAAIVCFVSPTQFWPAYGFWICLILSNLLIFSGLLGPQVKYWEGLCLINMDFACGEYVDLFYYTIPFFLLSLMVIAITKLIKTNKIYFISACVHIALIFMFSELVSTFSNPFAWR